MNMWDSSVARAFISRAPQPVLLLSLTIALVGCSGSPAVTINSQPVYNPRGVLPEAQVINADLQGCINIVMGQQGVTELDQLTALSCANSGVTNLDNIERLAGLRFLDLSGNNISNITPLENLRLLGGLNLNNNSIRDIRPLYNIPTLASVSLSGNDAIPCAQIENLRRRLGNNLTAPATCRS